MEEKNYGVTDPAPETSQDREAGEGRGGYDDRHADPYGARHRASYYGPEIRGSGVREEETWSALAHLSIFLNLVTGFLGPVAALIVWLVYRDRSPRISFHALQSMWYQVGWLLIISLGWTFTVFMMAFIVGFLFLPVMIALSVFPFAHAAYAAYKVMRGEDFRYPLVADLIGDRRL